MRFVLAAYDDAPNGAMSDEPFPLDGVVSDEFRMIWNTTPNGAASNEWYMFLNTKTPRRRFPRRGVLCPLRICAWFVGRCGHRPLRKAGEKAETLQAFPLEVIPPHTGEMSAQPTKGARLREKKVARLYAATDEVSITYKSLYKPTVIDSLPCVKGGGTALSCDGGIVTKTVDLNAVRRTATIPQSRLKS